MNPTICSTFPNIELEEVLKTGAHGTVCLVRDVETKTRYIYREFQGSSQVYQKLQEIDSPYLPKIFGLSECNGQVFVLEEFIQGDTLAFLLEGGALKESYAKDIAIQICQALQILHSSSIIHRDIKPENILVHGNQAVLIDFDAARQTKPENTTDTQIMGTTGYAAPEQYGLSQTDARADIYSLGIVFNEMLTMQHPSKQLAQGKFRSVIERCTEMNMDKRYPSAEELYNAIQFCAKKNKEKRIFGLILVSLLAIVLLWFGNRTPSVEPPQETQVHDMFVSQTVEVVPEQWLLSDEGRMTAFTYDLDGDGESEAYQFGIYHEDVPEGHRYSLRDYFALEADGKNVRNVYPCVWRYLEDGSLEMVGEFAPLLENAEVKLWCASEADPASPRAYTVEGLWPGGIRVIYTYENQGTWIYQIHATLGDQELTAVAKTIVDSYENYLKVYGS